MSKIKRTWAREILDSRANPTVETGCLLESGHVVAASVPSGSSRGSYEAVELRDNDPDRFLGRGVLKAVENVNSVLGPAIVGMDPREQVAIDNKLIQIDGTENKSKLGGNAILSISLAVAKAGAIAANTNQFFWINYLAQQSGNKCKVKMPTPLFNMINGGLHGAGNLDFQEFHVIPVTTKSFYEGLQECVEIYLTIGKNLSRRGAIHSVGDEGGYAPNLFTNADALEVFVESIRQTKYQLGRDVFLGLDVAAGSFYKNGEYTIRDKSASMDDNQLLEFYKSLNEQYKLALIEDPFYEDGWESWKKIVNELSKDLIIVGDDLLATNPKRVKKAIEEKACNAILVKPNQIGTLSETLNVIKMAKDANWKIVVSHRSGETNDSVIADFAVGIGADYVKFGAPARGERVAKYNRLSAIESELTFQK
ncbi:phosphopyruvate hydratase [Patescibacteria group bacterium]|nr:phosphopyruvate hydratase [Patescibacteria group bacterium]